MRIAIDLDPVVLIMVLTLVITVFFWSILRMAKKPTPKPPVKEAQPDVTVQQ